MNERNTTIPPAATAGKTTAIIAYLTLIGFVVALIMNNEKKEGFASFHIKQVLGLGLTGLALSVINVIPILGWIVSILGIITLFILWIIGLINAINGKTAPIPILGEYYQKWFDNLNI